MQNSEPCIWTTYSVYYKHLSLPVLVGLGIKEVRKSCYSWPDLSGESVSVLVLSRFSAIN